MSAIDDLIDLELLELLHERIRGQLNEADLRLESLKQTADELRAKLFRVEERMGVLRVPHHAVVPPRTAKGRVRKGVSEPLILEFVKSSNGVGVTVSEIISATGTKYGTVRRVLRTHPEIRPASNSRWRWAPNLSEPNQNVGQESATIQW